MGEELFTLSCTKADASKEELLAMMDLEVESFSRYMDSLDSPAKGALNNPEKALVKTFMVFMMKRNH